MTNRRDATVQTVFCGVDWISGTLGREEKNDQAWISNCLNALSDVQALGNTYKRRSLLGFDGWESGGCFVGSNDERHYAQFAGKYADDAYHHLDHPRVHISRIDLQITVQYDVELIKEGRYQYASAIRHNKSLSEFRRRRIHLYAGSDGADTVYVGSPSSDVRGRLYNKARQSGDKTYERSWRYEVVYRNEYAARMFGHLLNADTEVSKRILQEVASWYSERGVDILGLGDIERISTTRTEHPQSDVDRKLRWVRTQVIPTIRKLAELGYAEELMDAIAEAISAARNEQL